jgi:hypothetical protein
MALDTEVQADDLDYLSMSDDDLGEYPEDTLAQEADEAAIGFTGEVEVVGARPATDEETEAAAEVDGDSVEGPEEESEEEGDDEAEESSESTELDFAEEFKKLTAPFKANGKNMQINTVDEARTLMMMGANYNKKMAGLKPSLRILKTLENNGLLDEDKLNYLIDLDKKDPGAINKLMKDSGINPLDLEEDGASAYKPKAYNATNREVELDSVLDDIRDTPTFKDTIDIVGNKWDDSSRRVLVENPSIIKVINDHVSAGIFEQITTKIEKERMLGKLNGVSDIEAYKQIGDLMQSAGEFNAKKAEVVLPTIQATPVQKASNIDKKRAAASTVKTGRSPKSNQEFNPLALSDEEFAKLSESNFS